MFNPKKQKTNKPEKYFLKKCTYIFTDSYKKIAIYRS